MLIVGASAREPSPFFYSQTHLMRTTQTTKQRAPRAARLTLLACLSAATFSTAASARQAAAAGAEPPSRPPLPLYQIVPAPKCVALAGGGNFNFRRGARLVVADPKSEDDRFAAEDFADDLRETAGVALRVGTGGGGRQILVGPLSNARVRAALEKSGASIPANLDDEGYVLAVGSDQIVAAGRTAAGTFYALQTLKQLVRGEGGEAYAPGLHVTDWPSVR